MFESFSVIRFTEGEERLVQKKVDESQKFPKIFEDIIYTFNKLSKPKKNELEKTMPDSE